MKTRTCLAVVLASALCVSVGSMHPRDARADSLDDVIRSGALNGGEGASDELGLEPGSNYASIFEPGNIANMNGWAAPMVAHEFNPAPGGETLPGKDYVSTSRVYESEASGQKIEVTIVVPHPRTHSSVKMGVFKRFLEPPPPDALLSKKESFAVPGADKEATFYRQSSGPCGVVIPLVRFARVELTSKTCSKPEELKALAGALNIKRLNDKLGS